MAFLVKSYDALRNVWDALSLPTWKTDRLCSPTARLRIAMLRGYSLALLLPSWALYRCALLFLPRECAYVVGKIQHARRVRGVEIDRHAHETLLEMLICGEDRRFLYHHGFDPLGILRAAYWTARGRLQGASTIEQQLARTLTREKQVSIRRKVREILLATCVAFTFSKRVTAVVYLGVAYYGSRMNGLAQASRRMTARTPGAGPFDKHRAAGLVARLKHPEPGRSCPRLERAIEARTRHILGVHERLQLAGWFEDAKWRHGQVVAEGLPDTVALLEPPCLADGRGRPR